jgi:hypothetical protein
MIRFLQKAARREDVAIHGVADCLRVGAVESRDFGR